MRPSFPVSELEYDLPQGLIAQTPLPQRDASRLLVVNRQTDSYDDRRFADLLELLRAGDLLVLNDTQVVPARFFVRRHTGGLLDGLFLREHGPGDWEVLLNGSARLKTGETLTFEPSEAEVTLALADRSPGGHCRVRVVPDQPAVQVLERVGQTPLPPYIRRPTKPAVDQTAEDQQRYQTVFAEHPGAVAAPTAGLHFTPQTLQTLEAAGVEIARVTLHVGVGTFAPVKVDDLRDHAMHAEWYELPPETAEAVRRCRSGQGRVVAVGTTSLRVLESAPDGQRGVRPGHGWTDLFCYPPYEFQVVDALLTNFHLPCSTLLALVMALGGVDLLRRAYRHAVAERYRFFSYGDAMLIR